MPGEPKRSRCSPHCPKVKQQLRAALKEAPWLSKAFLKRKDATELALPQISVPRDIRDKPKPVIDDIEYLRKITIDHHEKITTDVSVEDRIVEEVAIIREETVIVEKEKKELAIGETFLTVAPIKEVTIPVDELKIVQNGIDRATPTKLELEALQEPEPEKHVEYMDKEDITDYDRFIDEELQESLATVITKEIPQESEEVRQEDIAIPREEIGNRKDVRARPMDATKASIKRKLVVTLPKVAPTAFADADDRRRVRDGRVETRERPEDVCDETCPLINEQKERIARKLKERQRIADRYYLTKDFNYFEDVCTCSLACILHTLSRDQFVRSIFASIALFAIGLKLCSELDAWEMPRRVL